VVFEADYDNIELQNIVMTSFQRRHHHYVTEKRHRNNVTKFFQFRPLLIKISRYARSGLELIIWWSLKKAVLFLVLKKLVLVLAWPVL